MTRTQLNLPHRKVGVGIITYKLLSLRDGFRTWAISALGGYNQTAVSQLVYASRRASQQLESDPTGIGFMVNGKLKKAISNVDPTLGRIYGYTYDRR